MKRWAIPFALARSLCLLFSFLLFFLLLFFLQVPPAKAQSICNAVDSGGTGTVNWSVAFGGCVAGEDRVIPAGITVVLDDDVALAENLQVVGALDATSQQHTLTLVGLRHLWMRGAGLKFYDLVMEMNSSSTDVNVPDGLEVTHHLTIKTGRLRSTTTHLANLTIELSGRYAMSDTLYITGNLVDNGVLAATEHDVVFEGGGTQLIDAMENIYFGVAEVTAGTTVQENPNIFSTNVLAKEIVNHGVIHTIRTVTGAPMGMRFGLAGSYDGRTVLMNLTKADGLTQITLERNPDVQPTPPDGQTAEAFWKFITSGANIDLVADLSLPYQTPELSHPLVCQYVNSSWDCAADGTDSGMVKRNGLTELGVFAVFEGTPTTLALAAGPNPAAANSSVTFTATVNPVVTGDVQFYVGGVAQGSPQALANGSATTVVSGLAAGTYAVTAKYLGDGLALPGNATLTGGLRIKPGAAVTLAAAPAKPVYGEPVTLGVTVEPIAPATGTPNGAVTFKVGASTITGCDGLTLDNGGAAQCITSDLPVGTPTVRAEYSGNIIFAPASNETSVVVAKAATTTALTSARNPAVRGESITVVATVTANTPSPATPDGNVAFADAIGPIASCSAQPLVAGAASCTFATTNIAGYELRADYLGSTNFEDSHDELDQAVSKGDTTVLLSAVPAVPVYGESVTFTAAVAAAAPGTGVPTATVTFKDGTAVITGCDEVALNGSATATCTTSNLGAGSHAITAEYSGNDDFNASSDASEGGFTVNQADTAATVIAKSLSTVYGESVTFEASVAAVAPGAGIPTANVTFKDGTTAITGCTGVILNAAAKATCTTAELAAGTHTITVDYSGNDNFAASSGSVQGGYTVAKAMTEVTLTSSSNPSVYGASVTLTAAVVAASPSEATVSGAVNFADAGSPIAGCQGQALANGQATCTLVTTDLGGYGITASFDENGNFLASTDWDTQLVDQAEVTVAVSSGTNPSVYGEHVVLSAAVAVKAPGAGDLAGTVTFKDNGSAIDACTGLALTAGTADCAVSTLGAGTHPIAVEFGNDPYFAAASGTLTGGQVVNQNGTTTVLAATANPAAYGETVFITATVQAVALPAAGGVGAAPIPTGTVTFAFDAVAYPTPVTVDASGLATLQLDDFTVGSHVIAATYGGNMDYSSSTAETITQGVDKAATQTSVVADPSPSVLGETVGFTATVLALAPGAGTPTGSFGYSFDGGTEIMVPLDKGATATYVTDTLAIGLHSLTVRYAGDSSFQASTEPLGNGHTVEKAAVNVTPGASPSSSVFGQAVTFDAAIAALPPGTGIPTTTVAFKDGTTTISGCGAVPLDNAGNALCTASALSAGSHTITVEYGGNDEFNRGSGSLTGGYTVGKAATELSVEDTPNPSTYGQPVVITATVAVTGAGSGTPGGAVSFQANTNDIEGCQNLPLTAGQAACNTTTLPAGANSLRLTYAGDASFEGSYVEPDSPHQVNLATPVVMLTGAPNPSAFRDHVVFTATVSAPSYPAAAGGLGASVASASVANVVPPTGTVTFDLDGVTSTMPVVDGVATISTASLGVGDRPIGASYNGSPSYATAASAVLTQTVAKAGSATVFEMAPNPAYWDEEVVFTATVSYQAAGISVFKTTAPTGTVTFTDATGTVNLTAELDQGVAVAPAVQLPAGTYTVYATYGGNSQFTGSAASPTTLVINQHASATTLTSSDNPGYVDRELSFHVEVGKQRVTSVGIQGVVYPTGTITLADPTGAISLTGALAQGAVDLTPLSLNEGTYNVVASYAGDSRFEPSVSALLVQVVKRHQTAATLSLAPNLVLVGDAVVFTVTIGIDDSDVKAQDVTGQDVTGQDVTGQDVTVQKAWPAGQVRYWVNGSPLGAIEASNGLARLTSSPQLAGNFVITATYLGNRVYAPSTTGEATLTVKPRLSGVALAASPNPARLGESIVFTATVAEAQPTAAEAELTAAEAEPTAAGATPAKPVPTGTVVFLEGESELGRSQLQAGAATLAVATLDVGTHELKAYYAGSPAFYPATSAGYTQVVQPLPLAVNDAAGTLEGQLVTVAVLANDLDPVGGGLTVITLTQPANGVAAIDPTSDPTSDASQRAGGATVIYTPNAGFAGVDGFSYMAQDANGNIDDGYVAIVVAAQQQNGRPAAVAPVDPAQESHAVFTDTHTSVALVAPVGVYTGTLTDKDVFYLAYTPVIAPTGDINQAPGGMKFGNYVFHLDAFLNGGQLENFKFAQPITLTISYDPLLLGNLREELLVLYYWNGATWAPDGITVISRDATHHTLTVRVEHLSEFSFFSAPELQRVILPFISNHGPLHTAGAEEEAGAEGEAAPAEPAPAAPPALPDQGN